jgi:hypothetical protein
MLKHARHPTTGEARAVDFRLSAPAAVVHLDKRTIRRALAFLVQEGIVTWEQLPDDKHRVEVVFDAVKRFTKRPDPKATKRTASKTVTHRYNPAAAAQSPSYGW